MDIGRAFNYVFQDPKWLTKVIIGGLLILIPIFGWFVVSGYSLRIMRNVTSGSDVPLPEWDDFGALFVDGFKGFIIGLVWSLPAIIIGIVANISDSLALNCISTILSLLTNLFVLSALVAFARSADLNDGFQFQATINRVMSNLSDYIIIFLLGFVLAFIAVAGVILCIVGVFLTVFYVTLVNAHLGSQAYMRSTGASIPPAQQAF